MNNVEDNMEFLVGATIFMVLVGTFITTYKMNKATKVPEGCDVLHGGCGTCHLRGSCSMKRD